MRFKTPFFREFGPLLFGRRPVRRGLKPETVESLSELQSVVGPYLPPRCLGVKARCGSNSRERHYSVGVTFWAFLSQVLSPQSSCREVVRKVQAWWSVRGVAELSGDTGAYCRARQRLPQELLEKVQAHLARRLEQHVRIEELWQGRRVKVVDGTMLSMPDTGANQAAWPQTRSQEPGLGFPILRLVGLFCLSSGALLHTARGTLREHETTLFRTLWKHLAAGEVLLADRGFCSFFALSSLLAGGVDSVLRLRATRKKDGFHTQRVLGPGDRLILWRRPMPSAQRKLSPEQHAAQPATLLLREIRYRVPVKGFRTQEVTLVTTLLDPLQYPADALEALYLRRWSVELCFRDIKTTLGMDILRCKTPAMIEKELTLHLIGYNVIRSLMQEASARHAAPLETLSFKGTMDTLRQWAVAVDAAARNPRQQTRMLDQMLAQIAADRLPDRPHRSEPRAKKRRPKNFHLLSKPRHQMGNLPHRNYRGVSIPNPA